MIHQPSGGTRGQATDIQIHAEHIIKLKKKMNSILAERTGADDQKDRGRYGKRQLYECGRGA